VELVFFGVVVAIWVAVGFFLGGFGSFGILRSLRDV
jgi:hypothetical protein